MKGPNSLRGKASAVDTRTPGRQQAAEREAAAVALALAPEPEPVVVAARCTTCQSWRGCSASQCLVCGSTAIEFLEHVDGRAA